MPNNVVYSPFELDGDYDPLPAAAAAAYVVRSEDETILPTNSADQEEDHHHHQWVQNGLVDFFSLVFGQQQQHNPISLDQKKTDQESNMIVSDDDDDWTHQPQTISSDQILITKQDHADENRQHSFSLASLDLLNNYGKGFKMMSSRSDNIGGGGGGSSGEDHHHKLSVEEILRVAGERFIQFSTNTVDGISAFIHPYYGSSLSGISIDDARDVELIHLLLDAADKVGSRRFDLATKQIIFDCLKIASPSGSPVQRVSYYFAEALQEKIDKESSITNYNRKTKTKTTRKKKVQRLEEMEVGLALGTNNTFLTTHQELPFAQVMQFAAVQAIIDNIIAKSGTVAKPSVKKIHMIDLQIRSGIQWTALMQGLVDYYPTLIIQRFRITAVATSHDERGHIEETGKRLTNFANSLNLPFSFEIVYLKEEDVVLNISTEADETVAVYSYMMLRTMISRPDLLENLMRAIAKLRPSLMLVIEVEANHNSPSFVDRFIEALLFYSSFFDCLEDCMDERSNEFRRVLENTYFGEGITNIVAAEGEERVVRNIKLDVWRPFFSRFGMIEIELSESSKYQAGLVLNKFPKGSSCTLEFDAKGSLTVGWKGTPLHSLTVWKFSSSYC